MAKSNAAQGFLPSDPSSLWTALKKRLKNLFPSDVYDMWFEPTTCVEGDANNLILNVPNEFAARWIQDNYLDLLSKQIRQIAGRTLQINLRFPLSPPTSSTTGKPRPLIAKRADAYFDLGNTFEHYVVGTNNQLAHAAALAVAQAPAQAYNPLFVHGGRGEGKTHLIQAIGHSIRLRMPEARVVYTSAERFTREYVRALEIGKLDEFRRQHSRADVLLFDDASLLANNQPVQDQFLHVFNELFENQKQIVVASTSAPDAISNLKLSLSTRFQWGLIVEILPPEYEARLAIAKTHVAARRIEIRLPILEYIARNVSRSVRHVVDAIKEVTRQTVVRERFLTLEEAVKMLHPLVDEGSGEKVAFTRIQRVIAEHYGLARSVKSRRFLPKEPTRVAMFFCREFTQLSLQEIAMIFDEKDEGVAREAIQWVKDKIKTGDGVATEVATLRATILKSIESVPSKSTPPATTITRGDAAEALARARLQTGDFAGSWQALALAIADDPSRKDRLKEEFSFAFPFDTLPTQASFQDTALGWRWRVWRTLSTSGGLPLAEVEIPKIMPAERTGAVVRHEERKPEIKGQILEQATARLFAQLFQLSEIFPWKLRQQKRGTQDGFDLSVEWREGWGAKCDARGPRQVRCHIECKYYERAISMADIADKLLAEPINPAVIDHWILVSPIANPTNPLNRMLEEQRKEGRFPFEIQIWSPESGVDELFGLEPDLYDQFYLPGVGETHPRDWPEERKRAVLARWTERLEPRLQLPSGWSDYLMHPAKLCCATEDFAELEALHQEHVPLKCLTATGLSLGKPLLTQVEDWLETPAQPVMFVLGEFGDGKTTFTYLLARQLAERWLRERGRSWIPLRLNLKRYPGKPGTFLQERLQEFGATVSGWVEMSRVHRRLAILDGFDEMSVRLDPESVTQNIAQLLACVREFVGCKVLITSRKHFFENRSDAQRLLARLKHPPLLHLAPIERGEVTRHLMKAAPPARSREQLQRIHQMNDPIGLAGKPLFLQMLKDALGSAKLPAELGAVDLYEHTIEHVLARKAELLEDPKLRTAPDDIAQGLREILMQVAEHLQRTGGTHVDLRRFGTKNDQPFAKLLWQATATETDETDARNRVSTRSLLSRAPAADKTEDWPVDFCHRSMREYFVALRLSHLVECDQMEAGVFLTEVPLNHEILAFAAERIRKGGRMPAAVTHLLALIAKTGPKSGRLAAQALTLLHRIEPKLPRDFDWREKDFDGADLQDADLSEMDFRKTTFRYSNLPNANFSGADFRECDLTGVRLEETAGIVALAAALMADRVFAFYQDGVLREWKLRTGARALTRILARFSADPQATMGIHETGQLWLHTNGFWHFFVPVEDNEWRMQGRFRTDPELVWVSAQGSEMAVAARQISGGRKLSQLDLDRHLSLWSLPVPSFGLCARLDGQAAAVANDNGDVAIVMKGHSKPWILTKMPLTALAAYEVAPNRHWIAGGTAGGMVHLWEVAWDTNKITGKMLFSASLHEGVVSALTFAHGTTLISGGTDRAVIVSRVSDREISQGQPLRLRLLCEGMKVEGLEGPQERAILMQAAREAR